MPRRPYSPPTRSDAPAHAAEPLKLTRFRHPGYEGAQQIFLVLPAADHGKTLHHKTAHAACAIIACNEFQGFLSRDRTGRQRVDETQLEEEDYFFQVPISIDSDSQGQSRTARNRCSYPLTTSLDLNHEYPLHPNFRHWSPPVILPDLWERLEIPHLAPLTRSTPVDALTRDETCRVTLHMEKAQVAHIIPTSEEQWYHARGMSLEHASFQSAENKIVLKPDIHQLIDEPALMIVPREMEPGQEQGEAGIRLCLHLIRRHRFQRELLDLYHDVPLQPVFGISKIFLFCRFALSVFGSMNEFLAAGVARWLAVWDGAQSKAGLKTVDQCRDYVQQSRTRSSSPRKRLKPGDTRDNINNQRVSNNSTDSTRFSSSDFYLETDSEGEQRGRKRTRLDPNGSSSTASWSSFVSSNATSQEPFVDDDQKLAVHPAIIVECTKSEEC